MKLYVVDEDGKVVECRGTITAKQKSDGCGVVAAKDPPSANADPETGGWKEGTAIPATAIVDAAIIVAASSLPKSHIMNLLAFPAKK